MVQAIACGGSPGGRNETTGGRICEEELAELGSPENIAIKQ